MALSRQLARTVEQNALINYAYSRYLNHTPRFLTPDMVTDLARECACPEHDAFLLLLSAAMGLDTVDDPSHRQLERLYIKTGVRCLDPAPYLADAYRTTVRFPQKRIGNWEILQASYAPYEPFVWRDPVLLENLCEIPQIGYFEKEFTFPAIHQGGVEWMSIKPNEVETMREPIQKCRGRVLTLGLGLGYFAFHASEKQEVTEVTVIERDAEVIGLFKELLLPQFPNRKKIRIIHADAFDYIKNELPKTHFDYAFADLWHDASDGLELYLRLRAQEHLLGGTPADYWIEPSLLSSLRYLVYRKLTDGSISTPTASDACLGNAFLRTLSPAFLRES